MILRKEIVPCEAWDEGFARMFEQPLELETLAGDFAFTEGPAWHDLEDCLLFTDIPSSRIYRWDSRNGLSVFRDPSGMANGLAFDRRGRLLCCEHGTSSVTQIDPSGCVQTIAATYNGQGLNSPNDVVAASDGTIFFTDPIYGREAFWGVPRPEELGFRGVYAVDAGSSDLRLLANDFLAPNGLCLSADESVLFVNDSERNHIRRLRLATDGSVTEDAVWACLDEVGEGSADGMKLDCNENLFCCGPGGIHVFSRGGACLGIVRLPEFAANLCFGGEGLRDLFITATTRLFRLRVSSPGLARDVNSCARLPETVPGVLPSAAG